MDSSHQLSNQELIEIYRLEGNILVEMEYSVISNGQYSLVKGTVTESGSRQINKGKTALLLIDHRLKLCYDIDAKSRFHYLHPDTISDKLVENTSEGLRCKLLSPSKGDSLNLYFDKKLPTCLSLHYLFEGQKYGLRKIERKGGISVKLVEYYQLKKFDFEEQLERAKLICNAEGSPINLLFPDN